MNDEIGIVSAGRQTANQQPGRRDNHQLKLLTSCFIIISHARTHATTFSANHGNP